MMKKLFLILTISFLIGCDSENVGDCIQAAGDITQVEVSVDAFTKITVHRRVALEIKEGPVQKVVVETGENLQPEIELKVVDNELIIRNHNECNFFRDYGITKVYVTSPNLTYIRNASELNITSNGVLTYPDLYLRSSGERNEFLSVGDWFLNIDNQKVRIWSNGIANFYMQGKTDLLDVHFSDGDTRFEGKEFRAKKIIAKNVSSNDMLLYPIEEITGSIHSTGDIILFNVPPIIEVEELNDFGQLIIN